MCMIDDAEMSDLVDRRTRRARKAHRCGNCGRTIEPGETHEVATHLFEGMWSRVRSCVQCVAARQWLWEMCGGWLDGVYDIAEHADQDLSPALWRLAIACNLRWRTEGDRLGVEDVEAMTALAVMQTREAD